MATHSVTQSLPRIPSAEVSNRRVQPVPIKSEPVDVMWEARSNVIACLQRLYFANPDNVGIICQTMTGEVPPIKAKLLGVKELTLTKLEQSCLSTLLNQVACVKRLLQNYLVFQENRIRKISALRNMFSNSDNTQSTDTKISIIAENQFLAFFPVEHPLLKYAQYLQRIHDSIPAMRSEYLALKEFKIEKTQIQIDTITKVTVQVNRLKKFETEVAPIAPNSAIFIGSLLHSVGIQLKTVFEEYSLFQYDLNTMLTILNDAKANPRFSTHILSLNFFYATADQEALYDKMISLLMHRWVSKNQRDIVEKLFGTLFSEPLLQQVPLLKKCASIWRKKMSHILSDEEIAKIKSLILEPSLPMAMQVQFNFILRMQNREEHPGKLPLLQRFEHRTETTLLYHEWRLFNTVALRTPYQVERGIKCGKTMVSIETSFESLCTKLVKKRKPLLNELRIYQEKILLKDISSQIYLPFLKFILNVKSIKNLDAIEIDCNNLNESMFKLALKNQLSAEGQYNEFNRIISTLLKILASLRRIHYAILVARPLSTTNLKRIQILAEYLWLLTAILKIPGFFTRSTLSKTINMTCNIACAAVSTIYNLLSRVQDQKIQELGMPPVTHETIDPIALGGFLQLVEATNDFPNYRLASLSEYQLKTALKQTESLDLAKQILQL